MKPANLYPVLGYAVIEWLVGIALGCVILGFVAHGLSSLSA